MDYKVFGTDLDEEALSVASAGHYASASVIDLPAGEQDRIFSEADGEMEIVAKIRDRVVFARHDLLRDPPFPRMDLISCRNLLIYFGPEAQRNALERFCFSLHEGGLLFLGSSESVGTLTTALPAVDAKYRIFCKSSATIAQNFKVFQTAPSRGGSPSPPPVGAEALPLLRACDRLVQMFGSSGLIVSHSGEVVYSFGEVASWLQLPAGSITSKLDSLLPRQSRSAVMLALRQARKTGSAHVREVAAVDGDSNASLEVVHLAAEEDLPALSVLLFGPQHASDETTVVSTVAPDDAALHQIELLESELASSRQELQTTVEELETTNEEMQSVNEELLASNEELQSTNEELHSVNEELYTVNTEHQQKISELTEVTDDLEHLVRATEIGTLFLDKDMAVRRFTPSVRIAIPLRSEDIGRPLGDLSTNLVGADLQDAIRSVIETRKAAQMKVTTTEGVPLLAGVNPYERDTTGGAVVTFVDVRMVENEERRGEEHARLVDAIAGAYDDAVWVADADLRQLKYVSPAYEVIWGRSVDECLQDPRGWFAGIHPDDIDRVEREASERHRTQPFACEFRVVRSDGSDAAGAGARGAGRAALRRWPWSGRRSRDRHHRAGVLRAQQATGADDAPARELARAAAAALSVAAGRRAVAQRRGGRSVRGRSSVESGRCDRGCGPGKVAPLPAQCFE